MSTEGIDPKTLIWHYTAFDGLRGILEGALWASSLAYLNDTREYRYTVDIALRTLKRISRNLDLVAPLTYEVLEKQVEHHFAHVHGEVDFVTCFSGAFDDLSQWRAYTGKGPGFALGFDAHELAEIAKPESILRKCTYDPGEHQREIDQKLQELAKKAQVAEMELPEERVWELQEEQAFESDPDSARDDFIMRWVFQIYRVIDEFAPFFKHPSFSAEKETRLLRRGPGTLGRDGWEERYRLSGSLIVPYTLLRWFRDGKPCALKWIVVGPCPHPEAVKRATQEMAHGHGINPRVTLSEVPFRNW